MKLLIVEGDTNDGDYTYKITSEEELVEYFNLPLVEKVADAISKSTQFYNWNMSDNDEKCPDDLYEGILTSKEVGEFMNNYCPHFEGGIHTITSIKLYEVTSTKSLFQK